MLWRCGADDDGSSAEESEERRRRRLAKDDSSGEDASGWQRLALGDGIIVSDRVATRYSKHRPMDREAALVLRRAYRACVHWADNLVGEVLGALEADPAAANNTVVVFTSDHGYSLGENNLWQKNTLFEPSTHVPLLITLPPAAFPGTIARVARIAAAPFELVDLLPTLAALARVPLPAVGCANFSDAARLNASGGVVAVPPAGAAGEPLAFSFTQRSTLHRGVRRPRAIGARRGSRSRSRRWPSCSPGS